MLIELPDLPWEGIFMSRSDEKSAWWRVATDLARQIDDGTLPPGTELLSRNDLAVYYGVSATTVTRALGALKFSGRIYGEQGRGVFVGPGPSTGTENGDAPAG